MVRGLFAAAAPKHDHRGEEAGGRLKRIDAMLEKLRS